MIDYHRRMLADRVRNLAFERALMKVIKPGETVVADIGAGTGVLSFLAEKLGAKECHLYETGDVLSLAKTLAKENGMKHCMFFAEHSMNIKNPKKVDLVISETLGNYALEEHILEILMDAKRYLKPGGTIMPMNLKQFMIPVTSDRLPKELLLWRDSGLELKFSAAEELTFQNLYVRTVSPADLLGDATNAKQWDTIDFTKKEKSVRSGSATWTVAAPTTIHGVCLFWEAELVPGVTLSTSPFAPATHWEQIVIPLQSPLALANDESFTVTLHSDTRIQTGISVTWTVERESKGKKTVHATGDIQRGYLA